MDFKQLESFVTIAKFRSFSKASRELYLTQPALSNHIINLEKELNAPLFDRFGKNIELTEAGKIFLDYAMNLIATKEAANFDINNLIGEFDETIHIPYSTVPGEKIIPNLISEFSKEFNGIKFKLIHMDSEDVIEALNDKKYSIGFSGTKPNNEFEYLSVYRDGMVFIGPKSRKLNFDNINIGELSKLPLIVREQGSGSGSIVFSELKKLNLKTSNLQIVAVVEDFHLIAKLVELSVGYAFIPSSFADEFVKIYNIVSYKIDDISFSRDFYFINNKKAVLSPIENQFKQFVVKKFKNNK